MRGWSLRYDAFDPQQEGLREALCTLGNGYFATRGAGEEAEADDAHYPGTYLAGGYDRLVTTIAGRDVENEDLVNFPNWLPLRFRPQGGAWFNLRAVEILSFCQQLHLRTGLLERTVRFRDRDGRVSSIKSLRFVSMAHEHLAALRLTIQCENWSGPMEVLSALDGRVINAGVERYRQLRGDHLEPIDSGQDGEDLIWLQVRTRQSRREVAQAARTTVRHLHRRVSVQRQLVQEAEYVAQRLMIDMQQGAAITIDKVVAVYSSRDLAISESCAQARAATRNAPAFADLRADHQLAWRHLWRRCDILLEETMRETETILRLHIFHLLQTASLNTIEHDAGIPARGLHGEAYRGHVFWDELFIFPFLNLRLPELTRSLLRYRYRRLDQARAAAREAGYDGAMYPWQSGSDGREETQTLHLNPRSGRWLADHTHLQRHVNSAIAYNIWQYVQVTGDVEFLAAYGAEMFLEIARFWASVVTFDENSQRYEIIGVVGPDEYHDRYPRSNEPGLRNNAYTNVTAAWVLATAGQVLELLEHERREELLQTMGLTRDDVSRWRSISAAMRICFHDGVISQFEGYDQLQELDWERYREHYGDVQRLDRILEAEGDDVNRYQVSKQADVLMLFYLFSPQQLRELFQMMGYEFDDATSARTVQYYLQRTDHGSTLSRVVHSWVLARIDRSESWSLFQQALYSDISDIQGGTTAEGIHLGAMAGTVDLVQRCFTGLEVHDDVLWLSPALPDELGDLRLRLRFQGTWLDLRLAHSETVVRVDEGHGEGVRIGYEGYVDRLRPGECRRFGQVAVATGTN